MSDTMLDLPDIEKRYSLTIPRAQYDRLGGAFELDDTYFKAYDSDGDSVTFSVTERQRCRFAAYASEANRENKKTGHLYWICQMFLEGNVNTYMKG
jgi:hypothetical protein